MARPMSADELVMVDLADEVAALHQQLAIALVFRDMAKTAIEQLADANREREYLRRRVAALCDELRALRQADAA